MENKTDTKFDTESSGYKNNSDMILAWERSKQGAKYFIAMFWIRRKPREYFSILVISHLLVLWYV